MKILGQIYGKDGKSLVDSGKLQREYAIFKPAFGEFIRKLREENEKKELPFAYQVGSKLLETHGYLQMFPNVLNLFKIYLTLPVTSCSAERSFSDMKLIKTDLRSQLTQSNLDSLMRIAIEGPEKLSQKHSFKVALKWFDPPEKRRLKILPKRKLAEFMKLDI